MPEPYDISSGKPIDLSQVPPRTGPPPKTPFGGTRRRGRGTGTALDEYARTVLWVAFGISALLLAYLLMGLYSGAWAKVALGALTHDARLRQLGNIDVVFKGLQLTAFVGMVALLICTFRDEAMGYVLLAVGAAFYAGLPFLTDQIYNYRALKASVATQMLMQDFQTLAWLFFVPGLLGTLADFARRFQGASETAAIQRVNLKYGANVAKQRTAQNKTRTVFSRCWELPYCRENIRDKCPVYVKRQGPCWWHKEGCMCEEKIVLQAIITSDWKAQAAKADTAFNFGNKRSTLTPEAKRARCRNCIIYNEHQRQKYKAMVTVVLVATPLLVWKNAAALQSLTAHSLSRLDALMQRFSFDNTPVPVSVLHASALQWTFLGALCVVLLSQVLKLVEFWCFKMKI